jgi:CheY-like chemotaxis protein
MPLRDGDPEPFVLVVEDDDDLRDSLLALIDSVGLHALGAADGRQALACMRGRVRPSLILLDLMMPGMDGWTLRGRLLRDPELARIPVIVLTAHGDTGYAERALRALAVLRKPFGVEPLEALLHCCFPR